MHCKKGNDMKSTLTVKYYILKRVTDVKWLKIWKNTFLVCVIIKTNHQSVLYQVTHFAQSFIEGTVWHKLFVTVCSHPKNTPEVKCNKLWHLNVVSSGS